MASCISFSLSSSSLISFPIFSKNVLQSSFCENNFFKLPKAETSETISEKTGHKNSKNRHFVVNSLYTGNSRYGNRSLRLQATAGDQLTVRSVPVQVAKELVEAGHIYLDVRTPEEFSEGHIEGAVNIPFMFRRNGGMTKNINFLEDVGSVFDQADEIVVGCLSGKRSLMAVKELQSAEYVGVTDMDGGFEAWKESGLPVTKM